MLKTLKSLDISMSFFQYIFLRLPDCLLQSILKPIFVSLVTEKQVLFIQLFSKSPEKLF